jgi:hypothetical protein
MANLTRLGVNLSGLARFAPAAPCGCDEPKLWQITHHDHILDLAHSQLKHALIGRTADDLLESPFSEWCREHGPKFYERVSAIRFDRGHHLVRFKPVMFCRDCNAKDGNGKQGVIDPNIRWYSMTPAQLADVASKRLSWACIYRQDRNALGKRVKLMTALVTAELSNR